MCISAVAAVIEMGKLASQQEHKLRVDENTGTNLLSLSAQIALEVEQRALSWFAFLIQVGQL